MTYKQSSFSLHPCLSEETLNNTMTVTISMTMNIKHSELQRVQIVDAQNNAALVTNTEKLCNTLNKTHL